MNSDSYCAENYHPHENKKGQSGLVNSNNGGIVILSKFKQRLKNARKEMDNYNEKLPKKSIEKRKMVFKDNVVNLLHKPGD